MRRVAFLSGSATGGIGKAWHHRDAAMGSTATHHASALQSDLQAWRDRELLLPFQKSLPSVLIKTKNGDAF